MSNDTHILTPADKTDLLNSIPILGHMGVQVEAFERGYVKLRLPFAPNINHVGMIYAGSLFSLAETPGGLLFNSAFSFKDFVPVIAKLDIKFIKPALTDITVEARLSGQELQRLERDLHADGKARFKLSLALKNESGDIVTTTNGYYSALSAA